MTSSYCIVIEHEDGTVAVNGPYARHDEAVIAARAIGLSMADDEDREYHHRDDGCAVVGECDDNTTDVYAREMGTPIVGSTIEP